MKKRMIGLVLAAALLAGCGPAGTQSPEKTREFTDSTGNTLQIPEKITKIAVTGPLTQIYVLPLAADMMVGVSNAYAEDAAIYLPEGILEKTEIGQLYGGRGEMDLEALLAAGPEVVIDIGEPKPGTGADLKALTEQTGIPFLHIDATVATAGDAYRTLGQLLDREEAAAQLADWCDETFAEMTDLMARVDAAGARKSLLYCLGDKGTHVLGVGSFHGETIAMMGENLAVVEDVVATGNGNEVDLEQILLWDPEVILFAPDSCYDAIATSAQWQSARAVARGQYYKTPSGPYGWLSSPPAVQRYLGMLWLGKLLYPEFADYDLQTRICQYYKLFYGCDLTDEMYWDLVRDAL